MLDDGFWWRVCFFVVVGWRVLDLSCAMLLFGGVCVSLSLWGGGSLILVALCYCLVACVFLCRCGVAGP